MSGLDNILLDIANKSATESKDSIMTVEQLLNSVGNPLPEEKTPQPDIDLSADIQDGPAPTPPSSPGISPEEQQRATDIQAQVSAEDESRARFAELPFHQRVGRTVKGNWLSGTEGSAAGTTAELMRDGNWVDLLTSFEPITATANFVGGIAQLAGASEQTQEKLKTALVPFYNTPIPGLDQSENIASLKDYLKTETKNFNQQEYEHFTKKAAEKRAEGQELMEGAHGFAADLGSVIPNTAELAGVIIGSTLFPPAAPALSTAYLGKMGYTSFGQGLDVFDTYEAEKGRDPLAPESEAKRLGVGLAWAGAEVLAEKALNGITRFMPGAKQTGAGSRVGDWVYKKILGTELGQEAIESATRRFATENPAMWKKVASYGIETAEKAVGEIVEEGTTEVAQYFIDNYLVREIEDRDGLKGLWEGLQESTKGAVLMTALLGPVTKGGSYYQNRQRRSKTGGLSIGMSADGKVFEIVGEEAGTIIGNDKYGRRMEVDPETIIEQTFVSNQEFDAYTNGVYEEAGRAASDFLSPIRSSDSDITVVTLLDNTQAYLISNNGSESVVAVADDDYSNGNPKVKRKVIKTNQISTYTPIAYDDIHAELSQDLYNVAQDAIEVSDAQQQQVIDEEAGIPTRKPVQAGDMVEYGGQVGVLSIEPDGSHIVDGVAGGSQIVPPEGVENLRKATVVPVNGEEVIGVETDKGLEIQKEFTTAEEAAGFAAVMDQMYEGKRSFRVEEQDTDDVNKPNTFQIIGGNYEAPNVDSEAAMPEGGTPIDQQQAAEEQAIAEQAPEQEPQYLVGKKPSSRGFVRAKIKNAKTKADLEGVEVQNDPELQQMIQDKFPEGTYTFDGDPMSRDEAMELIENANSLEDLEGLAIDRDPDLEQAVISKFPPAPEAPQPQQKKAEERKQEDIPTIKVRKKPASWRDNPNSERYKVVSAEPVSLQHAIMQYLLRGGLNPDLFRKEFSQSKREFGQRLGIMNKEGHREFDQIFESIVDANPEFANIEYSEFVTQFMDIVWGIPTVGKLMNAAKKLEFSGADAGAMVDGEQQLSPAEQRYIEEQEAFAQGEDAYYNSEEFANEAERDWQMEQEYINNLKENGTETRGNEKSNSPIQEADGGQIPAGSRGSSNADQSIYDGGVAQNQGQNPTNDGGNAQPLQGDVRSEYGTENKGVKKDRYEELRNRLKQKGGNLNSGFDPDMFSIGAEMAAYHIEAGARSFSAFAKAMINDVGDWVKPYLKSFYMGARNFPGMEGYASEMDGQEVLDATDLSKIHNQDAQPEAVLNNIQENKEIAQAASQANQSPTDAQKEAGNYQMGHVKVQGMDITIENQKSSKRSGKDANGKAWEVTLNNHYGYFKRTKGKDGDQVDVFLGDQPTSTKVFIIDQVDPVTGMFDEHKVMMGFSTKEEALSNYNANYTEGWQGAGAISEMSTDEFRGWLGDAKRTTRPANFTAEKEAAATKHLDNLKKEDSSLVEQFKSKATAVFGSKPRGRFLDKKQAEILQKEIESNYAPDVLSIFNKDKQDLRLSMFNLDNPIAEKTINGKSVKIVQGLVRDGQSTVLLYVDGQVVGEFNSVDDVKKIINFVEGNLVKPKALDQEQSKEELTPNQQAALDKELRDIDTALDSAKSRLDNAKKEKDKKFNEVNKRNGLFGDNSDQGGLFAGTFIMNQETVNKAMQPYVDKVAAATKEVQTLEKKRKDSAGNAKAQGDVFGQDLTDISKNDNLDKNNDNVPDRPRDSQPDSGKLPNEAQSNEGAVPVERGRGDQVGSSDPQERGEGNGKQGSRQGIPDSRGPLFGEAGNRDVQKGSPDNGPGITGNFDGRGGSIDGTARNDANGGQVDGKAGQPAKDSGESFKQRTERAIAAQKAAENIPVKLMDEANIRETLPLLLDEQQDDVIKAEQRFFGAKTAESKKWANGKGIMFTNGTGTGKTFSGLGIVKRFLKNGAKRILIISPASKTTDWLADAKKINIDGRVLENTKDTGDGVIITSIENFRANQAILSEAFDLVVYDESHKLMEEKNGKPSATTEAHFMVSNRNEFNALRRIQSVHPLWVEYRELTEKSEQASKGIGNPDLMDHVLQNMQEEVAKIDARMKELLAEMREAEPALKEQAKLDVERTKVVFLSATPFKSVFNLRYAQGILFDWGGETTHIAASRGWSRVDPESQFFVDNFGSQFEWKYHRLQTKSKDRNDEAIAMQEVEFAERLIDAGVMSGRTIESNMDYGREFPVVATSETFDSEGFNKAFSDIYNYDHDSYKNLREAAREVFMSHHEATLLFEVLNTSMSLDRMQAHLDMGRKVAVYHRRQNGVSAPPFAKMLSMASMKAEAILRDKESDTAQKQDAQETLGQVEKFRKAHHDVLEFEQTLDYRPAPVQIRERFGDKAVTFTEGNRKEKAKMVDRFNDDNSGIDVIIVQEQSGKEGISLHDTTGKHPRVVMQMSKPNSSIAALQIEGRIYRIGQESNAIFEYPVLGLDMELAYYGSNLNKRLSTTENLAMGNQSRDLIRSFSEGILYNSSTAIPGAEQGHGGKEFDRREKSSHTPFQRARLVYSTNQKTRGKRDQREGVDFFATPEPVGQKMVEWAGVRAGDSMLEPSAGMGSIAMWMPKHGTLTAIEPSYNLFAKMTARTGDLNKKVINENFESLHSVNKFDTVVMNPPFGTGGKLAMDHLEKAFMHLKANGRVVALIPRGGMDKRVEKFLFGVDDKGKLLNPSAHLVASINLPPSTFGQAGTSVSTRIVIIDKVSPDQEGLSSSKNLDFSDAKDINELFDRIEDISMPERLESATQADLQEDAKPAPKKYAGEVIADMENPMATYLEQKHSKTGAIRHTVTLGARVSSDTFKSLKTIANKDKGFYSAFKGAGVTPGFQFATKEAADTFISTVNNNTSEAKTEEDGPRYKRKENFYSPTERALSKIKQEKGTPAQFKAMLLKNGAKEAELNWMGWDEVMMTEEFKIVDPEKANSFTITKAEIQEWIDENKVQLEEVVKESGENINPNTPYYEAVKEYAEQNGYYFDDRGVDGYSYIIDENINEAIEEGFPEEMARSLNLDVNEVESEGETKYAQYVHMGGANYKEVLLTMPAKTKREALGWERTSDVAFKLKGSEDIYVIKGGNDKFNLTIDGEDVSWHDTLEEAKKEGEGRFLNNSIGITNDQFKSSHWDEKNIAVHVRMQDFVDTQGRKVLLIEEIQSDWAQKGKKDGFKTSDGNELLAFREEMKAKYGDGWWRAITKEEQAKDEMLLHGVNGVPDMPFKQTPQWAGIALKRMLQYASEGGYDMIGWTTGQQQANRFDLSKQVDSITAQKTKKGDWKLELIPKGGAAMDTQFVQESELAATIGKDLAEKIVKDGGGMYSGLDLQVGGEGMKAFYDSILPSVAKKAYGKKTKVGQTEIVTPEFESGGVLNDKTTTVHAIELSADLKDAGLEEQAMFKKEGKAPENMTASEFIAHREKVKSRWKKFKEVDARVKEFSGKYNTPIHTVKSFSELPETLQKRVKKIDHGNIQGVYDPATGSVYIISDNMEDGMADRVILHEVLAHKGVRAVLGAKFNPVLNAVYDSMPEADKKAISELYQTSNPRVIADEYIAQLAENYKRPGQLKRIVAQIRNLIRDIFGINYSEADIMYLLSRSEDAYIRQAEPKASNFSSAGEYLSAKLKWENGDNRGAIATLSQNFKVWFGKSKIVDENGEPQVYYHATGGDFDAFQPNAKGLIFASPDAQWAQGGFMPMDADQGTSGSVMPVYVKVENPFDYRNKEQLDTLLESLDVRESIKEHIRNGSPWGLEKPAVVKAIRDAGYDGFYITEEGVTNIAAFNPNQMKSATGNDGGFDPNNDDVRFKKKSENPADLAKRGDKVRSAMQDRMITVKRVQQEVAKRAGLDKLEWWMDSYEQENRSHGRVLHATERLQKDYMDPLIKTVYDVTKDDSAEALSELQRYLKAKHAPERNRVISKRKELDGIENQSGFTDQEAAQIVTDYETDRDPEAIQRLWENIRKVTGFTMDRWLHDGFISKDQYDDMKNGPDAYIYYVPLRGHKEAGESIFDYQNNNAGKSVNPYRAAKGRESESEDPIQYMANMAQTAIVMGENNRVKQYTYRMATNHENPDLYHIKKVYYIATGVVDENGKEKFIIEYEKPAQELWDEGKVQVRFNNKRMAIDKRMAQEHEIEVMVGGERIMVRFENPEVANAINKNNVATFTGNNWLEGLARAGGHATRFLTANFTAKNPGFIVPNTVRDVAYAFISHAIKGGGADAASFTGHLATANKAMSAYNRWEKAKKRFENATNPEDKAKAQRDMEKHDTKNRKLMEQFLENGAATGYVHLKDVDLIGEEITKELTRAKRAKDGSKILFNEDGYIRVWKKSGEILEALAQRSENMSRFATYMVAIGNGKAPAEAAIEAKNITVNFNRKGSQSNVFGAFYAFLNAAIQGGENIARLAKNNPGKFTMGASMLYSWGFLTALLSHMNDDDEEENENKYKNINDYVKQNHFTLRYGSERYISIPLPHGWRAFYGIGVSSFENLFMDQEKKSKFNWAKEDRAWDKMAFDFSDRIMDAVSSVNPIDAFSDGEITIGGAAKVLAPTTLTPFVDIINNRDFAGREIARVPFTKTHAEFEANAGQFKNNVNPIIKSLTDKMYLAAGGDLETYTRKVLKEGELEDVNKMWDINPSRLEHLITYYTGGRGTFFNDLYKTTASVLEGAAKSAQDHPEPFESFDANDIPVVNRFNRKAYDYDDWNWYYGLKNEVTQYNLNRSRMGIERKAENLNPRIEMLDSMVKDIDKQLKKYREQKRNPAIIANPEDIIEIRNAEKLVVKEFRKAVKEYTR